MHGVPARVLPVPLWHTASVGLDLWLAAIAHGASQVWVLLTAEEAPEYRQALAEQMAVAQAILGGLGYAGTHLALIEARDARDLAALDAALQAPPAQGAAGGTLRRAGGQARHARPRARPPAGTGAAAVRRDRPAGRRRALRQPGGRHRKVHAVPELRRCLPEGALADNPDKPQLRFHRAPLRASAACAPAPAPSRRSRCSRGCGWPTAARRARRPACWPRPSPTAASAAASPSVRCRRSRPMIGKLVGHPAFADRAAERLKMCADCRVVDIHTDAGEMRITDL
ncbi:MAG: hypothetical protein IPM99_27865 [Rubrivivax sp.]|nr:hypothetical protein [Rubrivivax sp.]